MDGLRAGWLKKAVTSGKNRGGASVGLPTMMIFTLPFDRLGPRPGACVFERRRRPLFQQWKALPALATMLAALLVWANPGGAEESADTGTPPEAPVAGKDGKPEALSLPGLKINLKENCVDVDAKLCLEAGMLELIACTPDSKEHESIVSLEAKAAHIHAALLLLGAQPGNPAMRRPVNEEQTRWVDLPPRGSEVEVSLVFQDAQGKTVEHPIQRFMVRARDYGDPEPGEGEEEHFPTSTFLFAGSHLYSDGDGPPKYLADESGNVISISTFGDELLCLPGLHSQENGALIWEVDGSKLPAAGSKVILRLKPKSKVDAGERGKTAPAPGPEDGGQAVE